MKALISTTIQPDRFPDWLIAASVRDFLATVPSALTVEAVVIHDTEEEAPEAIAALKDPRLQDAQLIYVNDEPDTALAMAITGLNGAIYTDSYLLESPDLLEGILAAGTDLVLADDVSGDKDILRAFRESVREGKTLPSAALERIAESSSNVVAAYERSEEERREQAEVSVGILSDMNDSLATLKEHARRSEATLKAARAQLQSAHTSGNSGPRITNFPPVDYQGNKPIYRVKDLGHMKYLTSFMLGLRDYLQDRHNMRPRLIFIESPSEVTRTHYREFHWVDDSMSSDDPALHAPVVFTSRPTAALLHDKLIQDNNYNAVICVDRTVHSHPHMVTGSASRTVYAANGLSSVAGYTNFPLGRLITSHTLYAGTLTYVPMFTQYPENANRRVSSYAQLTSQYEALMKGFGSLAARS